MGGDCAASDEQSRGIDQVALAESEMDRVTQQNASLYNNLRRCGIRRTQYAAG
jgi:methyl-accepting chemotaxis protein